MLVAPRAPILDQLQIAFRRRAECRGAGRPDRAGAAETLEADSEPLARPGTGHAVATTARWRAAIKDLGSAAPPRLGVALAATLDTVSAEQVLAAAAVAHHLSSVAETYSVVGQASVFFGPSVPPAVWETIPEERQAKWLIPYQVRDPATALVPVQRLIRGGVVTHGKILNAPPWVPDALRAVVAYGDLRVLQALYPAWGAPLGAELMTEWESQAGWNLGFLLAQVLRGEPVTELLEGWDEATRRWCVTSLGAAQAYDVAQAADWRSLVDRFGTLGVGFTGRVLATSFSDRTISAGLRELTGWTSGRLG